MNAYKTEMGRVRSNPLKLFFTLKHFLLLLFIGKIFITQDFGVYASEKIKKNVYKQPGLPDVATLLKRNGFKSTFKKKKLRIGKKMWIW